MPTSAWFVSGGTLIGQIVTLDFGNIAQGAMVTHTINMKSATAGTSASKAVTFNTSTFAANHLIVNKPLRIAGVR